jgi:hypothetical protein
MSTGKTISRASGRAVAIAALAGMVLPVLPAAAQTRSEPPARVNLRVAPQQIAPQGAPAVAPAPVGPRPVVAPVPSPVQTPFPTGTGSGVRANFPEPIRPGQTRLRLPPPPPTPPPVIVDPPPIFVGTPRPRRPVVIIHQPVYPYPYVHGTSLTVGPPAPQPTTLVPPATVAQPEPKPLTGRELGDAYLHWDEPERAVATYQAHLAANPNDVQALRMLGLALIDAGRMQEGIATLALAYERDTQLANSPILPDIFGPTDDLRRNLNRVSMYANRVNTASAWLALAVLMQAEGRNRPAAAMIDRALQAGLHPEVAAAMRNAVGRR